MGTERASAQWDGAMATTTEIRGMRLAIGEDAPPLGTTRAPLPTELLLASVASCFVLALAFVAARRKTDLPGLRVEVTGESDGPRIATIEIAVWAQADPAVIDDLIPRAQRVCWVTNTLKQPPQITAVRRSD